MRQYSYILAIEGGGSTCRAVLAHANGDLIEKSIERRPATLAGGNVAAAASSIAAAIDAMLSRHKIAAADVHFALCLPGASDNAAATALQAHIAGRYSGAVPVATDAMAALLAFNPALADGTGVLIAGTGSVFYGVKGGELLRLGGAGWPQDSYCGAGIAGDCLRAFIKAAPDPDPAAALRCAAEPACAALKNFIAAYNIASDADIDRCPASAVAALFPALLAHLRSDPTPVPFISRVFDDHAARCAADIADFCARADIKTLGLMGGAAPAILSLIKDRLPMDLTVLPAKNDALDGALHFASKTAADPGWHKNLKTVRLDGGAVPGVTPAHRPGLS